MFEKKYLIISLLFLIIAIGAISQVSASDVDAVDEIASSDASIEEVSADENIENEIVSADLSNEEIIANSSSDVPADDQSSNESVDPAPVKQVKISAAKLTTIYKSTKKFKVKVLDSDNKAVAGLKLKIKVYTGSKFKTFNVQTDSTGAATIKVSSLNLGKHKVVIETNDALYSGTASSLIKINKRPVTFSVKSIKDKDFGLLYITVKDKTLKKLTNKIPVKLLVYSGKKYKTYKLASSYVKDIKKKGAIMYLTNALSVGKHKVKIVAYGKYKGTKTSKITIRKSAKRNPPVYGYTKNGKLLVYVKYNGRWIRGA